MEWVTMGLRSILRPQLVAQVVGRLVGHTLDSSYATTGSLRTGSIMGVNPESCTREDRVKGIQANARQEGYAVRNLALLPVTRM